MNLEQLQRKLIGSARARATSQEVPFGFEKRVLAHLRSLAMPDYGALWARALWRAVAPCAAIMVLLSAWSFFATPVSAPASDLSQDLENTVLAAVAQDASPDIVW